MSQYPHSLVCLTEESVEFLYELGCEHLITGVSSFVRRPEEARQKPVVTTFTHANFKKILGSSPDLVIGFSDIQKDIARELIGEGLNVFVSNHRSLEETLNYLKLLGRIVDRQEMAEKIVVEYRRLWREARIRGEQRSKRPKVYLEEWDEPQISGIRWFYEVAETCGGIDIFSGQKTSSLAKERIVSVEEVVDLNPDIILASWCGKPVDVESFRQRPGWEQIKAVQNNQCYEIPSEVILQPGPALFKEAFRLVHEIFDRWEVVSPS